MPRYIYLRYIQKKLVRNCKVNQSSVPVFFFKKNSIAAFGEEVCGKALDRCNQAAISNCRTVVLTNTGHSKEDIVSFAEMEAVDIIVVGCRGLNAVQRVFVGSFSDFIVDHAHCTVMVVK